MLQKVYFDTSNPDNRATCAIFSY